MQLQSQTAVLTRNRGGYELTDRKGRRLATFGSWKVFEAKLLNADFPLEQIAKIRSEVERSGESLIAEED